MRNQLLFLSLCSITLSPLFGQLAAGQDKFLGCGYTAIEADGFAELWNQVTPGNAGKWGWVEGVRDVMEWSDLDEAYEVAKSNGFPFKLHTLVWGNQQPGWLNNLDSAEQRKELIQWFEAVAERYPDIDQIDVVNEPLHAPPVSGAGGYIQALGGPKSTLSEEEQLSAALSDFKWVKESFRLARQYFPNAELILNEYNLMSDNNLTDQYVALIRELQSEDLIDAVGIQGHGFAYWSNLDTYRRNLDTLAAPGLPVYVTEFDLDAPGGNEFTQYRDYQEIFTLFWEHPAVKGITLWGFRPPMWRDQAYIIRGDGSDRPAMTWLRAYLAGTHVEAESVEIQAGETSIKEFGGQLQLDFVLNPSNATAPFVRWISLNNDIATVDSDGLVTAVSDGIARISAFSYDLVNVSDQVEIVVTNQTLSSPQIENPRLFPNPIVNETLHLHQMEGVSEVSVLDIHGKILQVLQTNGKSSLSITFTYPAGIYLVKLMGKNELRQEKIIKL